MIKSVLTVGTVAGIAASLLMTTEVATRGMGAHHAGAFHHHFFWRYGGWVSLAHASILPVQTNAAIAQPTNCSASREIRTVPSEDGGERQITITRTRC